MSGLAHTSTPGQSLRLGTNWPSGTSPAATGAPGYPQWQGGPDALNRPSIGSGPGTGSATPAGPSIRAPSGNAALAALSQMPKPTPEAIAAAAARLQAVGPRPLTGSLGRESLGSTTSGL